MPLPRMSGVKKPTPLVMVMICFLPDSAVVRLCKKNPKDAGLERLRFHDLRHALAAAALLSGVDVKAVSSATSMPGYPANLSPRRQAASWRGSYKGRKKKCAGQEVFLPVRRSCPLSHLRMWGAIWGEPLPHTVSSAFCSKNPPEPKF